MEKLEPTRCNIYSVVLEVGAVAYFEYKLQKIVFVDFNSFFNSVFNTSMMDGLNFTGRSTDGVQQRAVILGFPFSISSFLGRCLKTETYC